MELSLTLSPGMWAIGVLLVFVGGKLLQQGGRMYGEGRSWMPDTIAGVACQLVLILGVLVMLIHQNTTPGD